MDLVRSHGVPVPQVYSYSVNGGNSVGAEYIIMEKVSGRTLGDQWYDLSEKERIRVLSDIVAIEAKLFAIDLPASGSVYYERDLPEGVARVPINTEDSPADINPAHVLQAAAEKESKWLRKYGRPRYPVDRVYREFIGYQKSQPQEHLENLERYLQTAPHLVPAEVWLHKPTLRHPDLQPNNIFVSEKFSITGLIDWQHCSVRPLFLCAGIPNYLQNYGDADSENLIEPSLPENLADMNEDDRGFALEQFRRRQLHFYYLAATATMNKSHLHACMYESGLFRRKIFDHAGEPWEGNNIPLKADLVRLAQHWPQLVNPDVSAERRPVCPIAFTEEEIKECLSIAEQQDAADTTLENLRGFIGISTDGWVSNDRYDHAVAQAALMKERVMEYAENDFEREMTEAHWPFDDHDEKE
ncbi:hypothetical protein LTR36_004461 [Oleoguttula mirabilis]|uniref:Aminoglycoside phosphotransferase domain-containing protein n=1 Tax=Oleoguttula mirabilis TaxID=1507867 RepID=A0AAV9JH19_9PEZI|nr:hypothetical protein LTR36_004461 [Oleoguttula mirabilis]